MNNYFKSPPFFISLGIIVFVGIVVFIFQNKFLPEKVDTSHVKVVEKWELPRELEEVSGLAYTGKDKIVCIQDEDGILFTYDLKTKKVEHRAKFGEKGDYEGLALKGKKAFVLRSDGRIFEISDFNADEPEVRKFNTNLKDENNVEGLCYDAKNNRLLLATKAVGLGKDVDFKGIYAFYLKTNTFNEKPLFKLKFDDPIFEGFRHYGKPSVIRPSEININPKTGDIYILDAEKPKILILDENFKPKQIYHLDPQKFPQAEGLTFSPEGKIFISNESVWDPANILQVEIQKNTHQKNENGS